jgi:predicted PurR-regulated permease PerM
VTPDEKEQRLYVPRFVLRQLGYVLGGVLALLLAYALRGVLVPLFLAFLLAYALDPLVDRVVALGIPRRPASVLVMVGILAVAGTSVTFAVPYLFDEFIDAAAALPAQIVALQRRVEPWLWERLHIAMPHSVGDLLANYGELIQRRAPEVLRSALPTLFSTFNFVVVLAGSLIIPIFALYLLMDFPTIVEHANVLVPRRFALGAVDLASAVHQTLGKYVRGQILACLVLAALYAVGLKLTGIRLAIPIGLITGAFAFVPYLGFGVGLVMALTMAILDWHGIEPLLGVAAVMLGVQMLDGFVITPRIVGGSVGLKPIEVLVTMMAAGTLFGFVGVLLAVPLGAVVKIMIVRATEAYLASRYYNEVPALATPTPYPDGRLLSVMLARAKRRSLVPTPMPAPPAARAQSTSAHEVAPPPARAPAAASTDSPEPPSVSNEPE